MPKPFPLPVAALLCLALSACSGVHLGPQPFPRDLLTVSAPPALPMDTAEKPLTDIDAANWIIDAQTWMQDAKGRLDKALVVVSLTEP